MHGKVFTIFFFFAGAEVLAQTNNQARCFSFTWLGPRFNNGSEFMNATCSEATRLSSGVPCFQPLVVSYDGTPPDTDYIWTHHATEASCILADTDVCATYSFYFNGLVDNVTHMCTRVEESGGRPISSGCYSTTNGNWKTQVCLCRTVPGGVPCNDADVLRAPILVMMATVLIVFGFKWDFNVFDTGNKWK